jgi:uncharacterized membrane protein
MSRQRLLITVVPMVVAVLGDGVQAQDAALCPLPTRYEVTDLTGLGGPVTQALAVNERGQIALRAVDSSLTSRSAMWHGSSVRNLSASAEAAAVGLSTDGRVAGWQRTSSGQRGAVWSGSTMSYLPPLTGHLSSTAADVNRSGVAIGWSVSNVGDAKAVIWQGGRVQKLGTGFSQARVSYAFAINDAGQIVGRGDFSTSPYRRALQWDGTHFTELSGLGGGSDSAASISGNGKVAGASLHPGTSKYHAVVWENGLVHDLGLLQGLHPTAAYGVNDCGTAVGQALVDARNERMVAVVWQQGLARNLNELVPPEFGWDLRGAWSINNQGQIVGVGYRPGAWGERAFLLTPVFSEDGEATATLHRRRGNRASS